MEQLNETTPTTTTELPAKSSGMKKTLVYLVVLAALGGGGYLAYSQGALDSYLPSSLQSSKHVVTPTPVTSPSNTAVNNNSSSTSATVTSTTTNSVSTPNTAATTPTDTTATSASTTTAVSTPAANTTSITSTNPAVPLPAGTPVVLSINGAPANALLSAMDAQWQWQAAQIDFQQRWDGAQLLSRIQGLKSQLQNTKDAHFAPAIAALAQVETQAQAWQALQPQTQLAALQQASLALDQVKLRTAAPDAKATRVEPTESLGIWDRIVASLKDIIVVEHVERTQNVAVLDESSAVLIKQSINAHLNLAQWAAHNGQWAEAQKQAKAANDLLAQWAQPDSINAFSGLKPLIDQSTWPTAPDLNTVAVSLEQTRAGLSAAAVSSAQLPSVAAAPVSGTPTTSSTNTTNANPSSTSNADKGAGK